MTLTCQEPTGFTVADDPQLHAEMAAAAQCVTLLADSGLSVAFDHDGRGELVIAIERPAGEPLRRLSGRELLALVALQPEELQAWARRPDLPIPAAGFSR